MELGWEIRWEMKEITDKLESLATVRMGPCLSGASLTKKNVWLYGKAQFNFGELLQLALSGSRLIACNIEAVYVQHDYGQNNFFCQAEY